MKYFEIDINSCVYGDSLKEELGINVIQKFNIEVIIRV